MNKMAFVHLLKGAIFFSKARFLHSPLRLVHMVTYKCNGRCKICNNWKKINYYNDELSINEIFSMLDDTKKANIKIYTVMGGEPLMKKDLPKIVKYSKKLGFFVNLVTNGYFLKDRYKEIIPFVDIWGCQLILQMIYTIN